MSYIFKLKICFQRNLPSFRFRDINVFYSLSFFSLFFFILSFHLSKIEDLKERRIKKEETRSKKYE